MWRKDRAFYLSAGYDASAGYQGIKRQTNPACDLFTSKYGFRWRCLFLICPQRPLFVIKVKYGST